MPAVVTLFVLFGFFGAFGFLLVRLADPAVVAEAVKLMVGAVVISLATAVGYWLGSSAGSRAKDAVLAPAEPSPEPSP